MKTCASPPRTSCTYQRIARDQAPADPDAVQQAYADLYQHLTSKDDSDALAMLKHLMNSITGGGAMDDEPMPVRPGGALDAQINADRALARQYLFDQQFPGAARIRVVG